MSKSDFILLSDCLRMMFHIITERMGAKSSFIKRLFFIHHMISFDRRESIIVT